MTFFLFLDPLETGQAFSVAITGFGEKKSGVRGNGIPSLGGGYEQGQERCKQSQDLNTKQDYKQEINLALPQTSKE